MSTILRTGKFIRCFASAARSVLNTPKGYDNNLLQSTRSLTFGYSQTWSHGLATQQQTESLEPLLQRLDAEVKRVGRLSRRDLDEMLEEVRHRHSVTSSQSLLIIRCCGSLVPEELPEVRTQLVEQIWKTLTDRGVPMDISHYNALLRVYIENEHDFSPTEFLKELEQKGLEPNRVTYQRLMWRHCQGGDVEGASRVLERMRALQLPLSAAVLDALVLGHSRLGDAQGARAVLGVMAGAGLLPSPRTYALLMAGSAARGDMDAVRSTLEECREKEIYLSDKDIMDVVEECAVSGHEEHLDFLLEQMPRSAGYNQDAISLILRLLTRGREYSALKVLRSLAVPASPVGESSSPYQGAFFIRHLARVAAPETVISICRQLQEENHCPMALSIATESALQFGNLQLAFALFRVLQEDGLPIRQHFFWPLLVARGKMDHTKMMDVIKMMIVDFKIGVSFETLREYIIPNLRNMEPSNIIDTLREAQISPGLASRACIDYLLSKNQIKNAADLAKMYGTKLNLAMSGKAILDCLIQTQDIESFATIVYLSAVEPTKKKVEAITGEEDREADDSENQGSGYRDYTGRLLYRLAGMSPSKVLPILPAVFDSLQSRGVGITPNWAEKIQEKIGENLTPDMSQSLSSLTAEDLVLSPQDSFNFPKVRRSIGTLENLVEKYDAEGTTHVGLKKQLLLAYMKEKQEDKVDEYLNKMEAEIYDFSLGLLANIVDFYASVENLEKCEKYLNLLYSKDPEFNLDDIKVIRIVLAYVHKGQVDKAMDLLSKQKLETVEINRNFLYNSLCWQVLNYLAETGELVKINEMFNLLLEKRMIEPSNAFLGPLVRVHIEMGSLDKALDEFEKHCLSYRCTPWKGELTRRLIAAEDAVGLQRLTDLSTSVHGEVNSLYDLVFGFVECGRLRQARRILETPGMRVRNQRFNSACERYGQEGKVEYLEGLLEATKELSHIDRSEVFQQLLFTYTREGNVDKAMGLWTLLQEESVQPTDKFLIHLAKFLKSNKISVPFVVPEEPVIPREKVTSPVKKDEKKSTITPNNSSEKFTNAILSKDFDLALKINTTNTKLTKEKVSLLMEQLVQAGRITDAVEISLRYLKKGTLPDPSKMKYLLNVLASKGDIENFEKIEQYLSDDQKRILSFGNRKCNAYINKGPEAVSEYLSSLSTQISSPGADKDLLDKSFPRGGAIGFISTYPALIPKYVETAEKYAEKGILSPFNVLWMHYLISGQDEEAQTIWKQHICKMQHIMFRRVLEEAREKNDSELLNKLVGYLKSTEINSFKAFGVIYSCQMDIMVSNSQQGAALETLKRGLSEGLSLEDFNRTALIRTKNALESTGVLFEYLIPTSSTKKESDVL